MLRFDLAWTPIIKHIRIRATWNGVTYPLWRGPVCGWPVTEANAAAKWVDITEVLSKNAKPERILLIPENPP